MDKNSYLVTFKHEDKENIKDNLLSLINDIELEHENLNSFLFKSYLDVKNTVKSDEIKNLFVVIKKFDDLTGTYFKPIFQWTGRHNFEDIKEINHGFGFKSFRIIIQDKERIISGHRRAIKSLEKKISGNTGMKINRVNPETEIWITHTKDNYGFILFKITSSQK